MTSGTLLTKILFYRDVEVVTSACDTITITANRVNRKYHHDWGNVFANEYDFYSKENIEAVLPECLEDEVIEKLVFGGVYWE